MYASLNELISDSYASAEAAMSEMDDELAEMWDAIESEVELDFNNH